MQAQRNQNTNVDAKSQNLKAQVGQAIEDLSDRIVLPEAMQFWVQGNELDRSRGKALNALSHDDYLKYFIANDANKFSNLKEILAFAEKAMETHQGKMMLFKEGVAPTWEDRSNSKGGRFHLSCFSDEQVKLGFAALILLVCSPANAVKDLPSGSQIIPFNAFTGFQCCLKPGQLSVELWNRNAHGSELVKTVRKVLKGLFKRNILYYVHKTSVSIQSKGIEAVGGMRKNCKVRRPGADANWTKPTAQAIAKEEKARLASAGAAAPAEKKSTVDVLETALVSEVLANAWKSRAAASQQEAK